MTTLSLASITFDSQEVFWSWLTDLILPFSIWMMKSFFDELSKDVEDAARLDGSNERSVFFRICLPQLKAGLAATAVFALILTWNEFLFAVQLGGNTVRPVTVAMYNFVSVEQTLWAKLSAAALIAMLPVVIIGIAGQRQIVKGLTVGAVKGGGRR